MVYHVKNSIPAAIKSNCLYKMTILNINRTRLKKWEYTSLKERGYCLGFYWTFLFSPYGQFNCYKLTKANEGGSIMIEIRVNPDKSVRDLIDEYICDNLDSVVLQWFIET
jgi:hypothetical protein